MALKSSAAILLIGTLFLGCHQATFGQEHRLVLFSYAEPQNSFSLTEPFLVDSALAPQDGVAFHPSEPIIFYTKTKDTKSTIYALNWETQERKLIYTADLHIENLAFTPDKKLLSFQENGVNTSTLLKLSPDGKLKTTLAENFPADNYLWLDDNALLVILSGDPNTLNIVTLRPRKQVSVLQHIGHTLSKGSDKGPFAFVHKLSVDTWGIKQVGSDGAISLIMNTVPGAEVFAITPTGKYLMSLETELYISNNHSAWNRTSLPQDTGNITGIRINAKGSHVALITSQ